MTLIGILFPKVKMMCVIRLYSMVIHFKIDSYSPYVFINMEVYISSGKKTFNVCLEIKV